MIIRITKELTDIPEFKRPFVGKTFEVIKTIRAGYDPQSNYMHIIEVRGKQIPILPDEYKLVKA